MSDSDQTRRRRRRSPETPATSRSPLMRTITACTLGVFTVGMAYQASFAQTGPGRGYGGGGTGGGGGGEEDNGGGLSTVEIAGIVVGSAAFIALLAGAFKKKKHEEEPPPPVPPGGSGAVPSGERVASTEEYPPLPADQTQIAAIRVTPGTGRLRAGGSYVFHVNAKGADGKWYSVTQRPETVIEVKDGDAGLTRIDGTKNIFCLPVTASPGQNGKTATLVGRFTPPGQEPITAEAQVTLDVSGQ